MTGLVAGKDKIIEIAAIITDKDLVPLEEEGFERIIHCDEEIMNGMDEWCTEHHRDVSPLPMHLPYDPLWTSWGALIFWERVMVEWVDGESRCFNEYHRTC
jgi:hypothetical protein